MQLFNINALLFSLAGLTVTAVSATNAESGSSYPRVANTAHCLDEPGSDCKSIVDVICDMKDSSTMCTVVKDAIKETPELENSLNNGTWTVFSPDNEAWDMVGEKFEQMSDEEVGRILFFHFYKDTELTYDELVCSKTLESATPGRTDFSQTRCEDGEGGKGIEEENFDDDIVKYQKGNGNRKTCSLPKIIIKDINACNGIIHSINHLMLPVYVKELDACVDVSSIKSSEQKILATYSDPIAHEGPVILNEGILFTSNRLTSDSSSFESGQHVKVSFYNFTSEETVDLGLSKRIPMANGAVLLDDGSIAILSQGTMTQPAGIFTLDPNTGVIENLTTSWGAADTPFNSPNDIVQARDESVWFTDPSYGFDQDFKPSPESGNWVWRYDYKTNANRLMADGFVRPNGIAFSPNEEYLYITDTGYDSGDGINPGDLTNPTYPRTIYRYRVLWDDVKDGGPFLTDRTVFAVSSKPSPDGIKVDKSGNVWTATPEGVEVFSTTGKAIGIVPVDGGSGNFALDDLGEGKIVLYVMNETKLIRIDVTM